MPDHDPNSMAKRLARITGNLTPEALGLDRQVERSTRRPGDVGGPESVGAVREKGRRGEYWRRSTNYNPNDPWGETLVSMICDDPYNADIPIPFDGSGERVPLRDCLFVDCETTGLSGGVGTVSFLTAVGRLTADGFTVDQYFLPDLAEEAGKLDALANRFADAGALVTYNGAAFDLPLIESRFNFWRIDSGFRDSPHLDLLHPTRALFKGRIIECNLGNVEERLLRFARIEDLPGAEVPEVYFQYLREGFSPKLHAVFEHNRLDVVSLFVYALWLSTHAHALPPTFADPDDLIALARFWFRKRNPDAALTALSTAEERVLGRDQVLQVHELRGRILKRERLYDDAHAQWEHVANGEPTRIEAAEELAKHLEHRKRDFAAALNIVNRALERLRIAETLEADVDDAVRERLLHRRARLQRKLIRQPNKQGPSPS